MRFNKLVSKSVIAIALLGTTLGGTFNVSADSKNVNQAANGTSKTETNSEAGEHVDSNTLTLDTVPNFQFNNQNSSNYNQLQLKEDGNLKVSDYRASDDTNQDTNGWSLSANADGVNQSPEDNNDWKLSLNQDQLDNSSDNSSVPTASTRGINKNFNLNTKGSNSGDENLIANGKYGLTSLTYHNNSNDALLNIPNVHPGDYHMNINWTLTPSMSNQD